MANSSFSQTLTQLEDTLDLYFGKKAPQMPTNIKEILVKIAPYLVIIGLLFAIPSVLILFGLGSLLSIIAPFSGSQVIRDIPGMWMGTLFLIPAIILEAMALPGLFSRTLQGWRYIYWAQLVTVVASILQFNILGATLSAIIGFYILFQVKDQYK